MNKTYPTLYARATTGKVLEWLVEQNENKYRVISGQKDGQKVSNEWTIAVGKNKGRVNETSDVEQVTAEIDALYVKKKKQKYKDSVEDIDVQTYFKPMLAKKYNDYKDKVDFFDGTWLIANKLNGMRCIMSKDGAFSRTGERILTIPHIEQELIPLFEQNPNLILDGELFNNDLRQKLNELISICRKTVNITEEDLNTSEQIVQYHVYDCFDSDNPELDYTRRFIKFSFMISQYPKYCQVVGVSYLTSQECLEDIYNKLINDQQEGAILRNRNSLYENKRSKNLLKMKSEDDDTCIILNVMEGDGNWSGKCKTFTVKWNDKIFDASLKGTMEQAVEIWNNKDRWIGREVTFLYMGLTGKKVPNFARVDYDNCIPSA
jgi:DNA ligase 1